MQHNYSFSHLYLAIYFFLFPSLSVTQLFCISFCLSTPLASPKPSPPSPLPLPLFLVGQQCGSSVVSIIIVQSALLSTRNCQHSTNTCLAINAIFLSSPLFSSPVLSSLIVLFTPLSNLLGFLIISSPSLLPFLPSPHPLFGLIFYRSLSSFSLLLVAVNSRSMW